MSKHFGSGQNAYSSGLCMGTNVDGTTCDIKHAHKYVPYCAECMDKGDPSLAVVPHPRFGRMLVTKRDLPKGYRVGLWGKVQTQAKMPEEDEEWGFETADGVNINPCRYPSSVVQFSQCPGPHEKVSLKFANPYVYIEPKPAKGQKRKEEFGCMVFALTDDVPRHGQLNMMYAGGVKETDGFFEERGLTRCDVWTKEYPTFLKKAVVAPKDLMMVPPVAKSAREEKTVVKATKGINTYTAMKKFTFDGRDLSKASTKTSSGVKKDGAKAKK